MSLSLHAKPLETNDTLLVDQKLRDTSMVQLAGPSVEREQNVFSNSDLKYRREKESSPGVMDGFLNSLSRMIFSKMDAEHVSKTSKIIMWTVLAISLLVIIRLLSKSSISGLTRQTPHSTVFNFNDVGEDLSTINYEQRIREALVQNDYRLAIRWHYMELLFRLDKKLLIGFAPHKTNIDYRYELKDKNLQARFAALSNIYDHVWYGQFLLTSSAYSKNAEAFLTLKKQLHV